MEKWLFRFQVQNAGMSGADAADEVERKEDDDRKEDGKNSCPHLLFCHFLFYGLSHAPSQPAPKSGRAGKIEERSHAIHPPSAVRSAKPPVDKSM